MDIKKAVENLEKRGFAVSHFETKEKAAEYLLASIEDTTVGIGGSLTVDALDIYDKLSKTNKEVYWHWKDTSAGVGEKAAAARVYLSSANAVAETGEIINIDGRGNRIAATLFDKDAVYIVVGINKFADSFDAALHRARNIAAPLNAQRLGTNTPCAAKADKCHDCSSPERICRGLTVLWGRMLGVKKTEVVIIDEAMGA